MPSIAVIGASNARGKSGNRAVRAYQALGWTVYPVNPKEIEIEGIPACKTIEDVPQPIDRTSLYVPPAVGIRLLDAISTRQVKELWVNPGSGSPELLARAEALGLQAIEACSIVAARQDYQESQEE